MKKKTISTSLVCGALLVALTGCNFGVMGSAGGGSENPYIALEESDGVTDGVPNGDVSLTVSGGAGFTNAANQTLFFELENHNIDADSVAAGIKLYAQGPNPDGNGYALFEQTEVTPASTEVQTEGTGSSVLLTYDLSDVDTTPMGLFYDASELTANGGTVRLNFDGDDTPGEDDDDVWQTLAVTGAGTTLTAGTDGVRQLVRNPAGNMTTLDYDVSDATYGDDTWAGTGHANVVELAEIPSADFPMGLLVSDPQGNATAAQYNGTVTAASLGNLTLQGDQDGSWTDIGLNITADGDSEFQLVPASALADGGLYRLKFDGYGGEATPWNGYIHRFNTFDPNDPNRYLYYYFRVNTGDVLETYGLSTTDVLSDDGYDARIDLTFSDSGTDDDSAAEDYIESLSADQVRVIVDPGDDVDPDDDEAFELDVVSVIRLAGNEFRLVLATFVGEDRPIDDDLDGQFNEDPPGNGNEDDDFFTDEDPINFQDNLNGYGYSLLVEQTTLTDTQNTDTADDDDTVFFASTNADGTYGTVTGTLNIPE